MNASQRPPVPPSFKTAARAKASAVPSWARQAPRSATTSKLGGLGLVGDAARAAVTMACEPPRPLRRAVGATSSSSTSVGEYRTGVAASEGPQRDTQAPGLLCGAQGPGCLFAVAVGPAQSLLHARQVVDDLAHGVNDQCHGTTSYQLGCDGLRHAVARARAASALVKRP